MFKVNKLTTAQGDYWADTKSTSSWVIDALPEITINSKTALEYLNCFYLY